jgi:hypothetical protein
VAEYTENALIMDEVNFTTLLFANDQIIIESEYKLQAVLIVWKYNLTISSKKTEVVTFDVVEPDRAKIIVDRKVIEQVRTS